MVILGRGGGGSGDHFLRKSNISFCEASQGPPPLPSLLDLFAFIAFFAFFAFGWFGDWFTLVFLRFCKAVDTKYWGGGRLPSSSKGQWDWDEGLMVKWDEGQWDEGLRG